jgi:hypothetical protein
MIRAEKCLALYESYQRYWKHVEIKVDPLQWYPCLSERIGIAFGFYKRSLWLEEQQFIAAPITLCCSSFGTLS